ncbi:4'-phosphopantetheinyl transferase superfamily protein [Sedimentibacter sp. zth1]|uniref:4'-phosphopantetheinyl transferase family protein n=1 Tax=Sedimentibacter sp. zth1 TaxID=2816908 RepID=UPI001A916ADB|nr:4'-phosphopantetheinyl transferase superfamily protein [Sedimentibacter sp. zth1]QSX05647.1 4'-phosphopantetheinyl transferase superfamily protein [Sedimentibacter sp. zth1]
MKNENITCYIYDVSQLNNEMVYEMIYKKLSDIEQWKDRIDMIKRYKFDEDKKRSMAAGILILSLMKQYGITNYELVRNDYGKPYFKESNGLFFNISHSGNYAVCSVGTEENGADIEKISSYDLDIAKKFFHNNEYKSIINSVNYPNEMFTRIWTLKESYIKAKGKGLAIPLNSFEIVPGDIVSRKENSFEAMQLLNSTYIIEKLSNEKLFFKEYYLSGYYISVCSTQPIHNKLNIINETIEF